MTTFQKIKLGDLLEKKIKVEIKKGFEYSFIPMENVESGAKFPRKIETKIFNGSGSKFSNDDVLFARITPCLQNKKIAKVKNLKKGIGFGSTEFFILRAKNNQVNSDYLYYLTKQDDLINTAIISMTGASGRQRADIKSLYEFETYVPDISTQGIIASVLSTYDDLIENNEKRIKILEEKAQLLYEEWFVKSIKCENLIELGEKIEIKKGRNITLDTVTHGKIPVVAGGLSPAYYHNKANAKNPVITISASGANAGFVNLYQEDVWASDCSYIDKDTTPFLYFYYLFLKNRQSEITKLQRGSAQPHVYPADLMRLKIVDISDDLLKEFENKIEKIFNNVGNFKKQNSNLIKLRDLLIPQLVTGKKELK